MLHYAVATIAPPAVMFHIATACPKHVAPGEEVKQDSFNYSIKFRLWPLFVPENPADCSEVDPKQSFTAESTVVL